MLVSLVEVTLSCEGVSDIDMYGMSFPVNSSASRLALENREHFFVNSARIVLLSHCRECVALLKKGRSHAQLRNANGQKFQCCGISKSRGCRVLLVLWVKDRIILGLQLDLVAVPKTWASNFDSFICTAQCLLGTILASLRQFPFAKLAKTQRRTCGLSQQQTQSKGCTCLRKPVRPVFDHGLVFVVNIVFDVHLAGTLILAIVIFRE
mmetsp:Transcript_9014/g.20964  ORF Transcript_9014/g.20964 Transcript_9014/m.20964 type:complete len:208 (+) Transcript_9014:342-965(+)